MSNGLNSRIVTYQIFGVRDLRSPQVEPVEMGFPKFWVFKIPPIYLKYKVIKELIGA